MAEDLIDDDVEYSSNQEEEDPILVAQRYLNIFHHQFGNYVPEG